MKHHENVFNTMKTPWNMFNVCDDAIIYEGSKSSLSRKCNLVTWRHKSHRFEQIVLNMWGLYHRLQSTIEFRMWVSGVQLTETHTKGIKYIGNVGPPGCNRVVGYFIIIETTKLVKENAYSTIMIHKFDPKQKYLVFMSFRNTPYIVYAHNSMYGLYILYKRLRLNCLILEWVQWYQNFNGVYHTVQKSFVLFNMQVSLYIKWTKLSNWELHG